MAGYIGSKTSVTQVDGYNRTEADAEFVNDPNSVISVSGSNVGIGISNPSAYYTNFNDLVLGSTSTHSGMTIVSGTIHDGTIAFADGTSGDAEYKGFIQYNHTNNAFGIGTNGLERMRIDSSGGIRASSGSRFLASSTGASTPDYSFSSDGSMGMYRVPGSLAFATGSTERMRIDAAGRVTMPYQPAFRVNATLSHSLGSGWSTVGYDTSLTQRGNGYNTSTSIFTAPVAGWYHFSAALTFTPNTDNDGTFAISINGSFSNLINSVTEPSTSGALYNGHSVSGSAYLAANDNVRVVRYSSVTTNNRTSQTYGGWFSGYLIG